MVNVLSFKFQKIWARFPCCFPKDPFKQDFLDIDVTMFFGVRNFGNTSAMRVIFFLKMFQIYTRFVKCRKKFTKSFFFPDNCI